MTIRTTAIILGLATLAGGCTITPRHDEVRVYQHERRVIHETDSYEGYYYVRIVYLNGIPWYVDEDLRARPVPRHLHSHFQYSSWARSMPPSFSRDSRMRDGYYLSRIVYINGVPHHVDEDRRVRPIPSKLRNRFSYEDVAFHDNGRRPGERSETPFYRNETRPIPPATGREREESPNYGRGNALERATERMREEARPVPPAATGREREESPNYGRGNALERATERMREEAHPVPHATGRDRQEPPAYEADNAPGRPTPPERMREETPQAPPAYGRDRQEPPNYGRDNALERATERMREETGRQDPPFARNVGNMPTQNEDSPSVRGNGREDRRPLQENDGLDGESVRRGGRGVPARETQRVTSPASREAPPQQPQDIAQRDRGQPESAGDDRRRGMDVANGHEQSADPAPERKNERGKGRMKDQETDAVDERDGDAPRRRGRNE